MPSLLTRSLLKATRLTRMGRLMDATRLIQRALGGGASPPIRPNAQPTIRPFNEPFAEPFTAPAAIVPPILMPQPQPQAEPQLRNAPQPDADNDPVRAKPHPNFSEQSFAFEGHSYPFRLFVPKLEDASTQTAGRELMPLVVLLHGCKQDALDFSKGTAMNVLAGKEQCLVLYPEQISRANMHMCWNWFEPGHQQEGLGEPGMIAALTRQVLASDFNGRRADPNRVYIAGLSAGGAMAAVVSGLNPELFTALGVHSGLPAGAASNVVTAFQAMRMGGQSQGKGELALPTIVFHGNSDATVHPSNGENITADALAALRKTGNSLVKTQTSSNPNSDPNSIAAGRRDKPMELTRYANEAGKPFIEYWSINNGPHAWSGGSKEGSYTDPDGPSASQAMLKFFLQHSKE